MLAKLVVSRLTFGRSSLSQSSCAFASESTSSEPYLFTKEVKFEGGNGHEIQVEALYQDTDPVGTARAVVIALHGSPGTHADFKYMVPLLNKKNIRLIGVNYPGHGHTKNDHRLTWHNEERNRFVQSLINALKLGQNGQKMILMGHSRGGENALQLAVSNIENSIGIVLLNCPGLRQHRGIQPFWRIAMLIRLIELRFLNFAMHPFLNYFYNNVVGLKVSSGEAAACAMLPLKTFAFDKQLPYIDAVVKHPTIKLLFCYSGSDRLISQEHSEEFASTFTGIEHFRCSSKDNKEDEEAVTKQTLAHFRSGNRMAATRFDKESHFLPKFRANYIVEVIDTMVTEHEKKL